MGDDAERPGEHAREHMPEDVEEMTPPAAVTSWGARRINGAPDTSDRFVETRSGHETKEHDFVSREKGCPKITVSV